MTTPPRLRPGTSPRDRRPGSPVGRRAGAAALAVAAGALLVGAGPATAGPSAEQAPLCGRYDAAPVDGGRYTVQNNRWGTEATQCVVPYDGGFRLERADGDVVTDGPPKSYPSIVAGCHWGRCSEAPGLPVRASDVGSARTTVRVQRSLGAWNVAYDLWFSSGPVAAGQADDAELMIWLDRRGGVQPLGAPVGHLEVEGAGWTVWRGRGEGAGTGWDVVTVVRDSPTSHADLALEPFVAEAVRLGALEPGSWLTSVQVGFEPWRAGAGLAVKGFSFEPSPS